MTYHRRGPGDENYFSQVLQKEWGPRGFFTNSHQVTALLDTFFDTRCLPCPSQWWSLGQRVQSGKYTDPISWSKSILLLKPNEKFSFINNLYRLAWVRLYPSNSWFFFRLSSEVSMRRLWSLVKSWEEVRDQSLFIAGGGEEDFWGYHMVFRGNGGGEGRGSVIANRA